jgi:hypothetical protein
MHQDDAVFAFGHALAWAEKREHAIRYAAWYVFTYHDRSFEALPAHSDAWETFLKSFKKSGN